MAQLALTYSDIAGGDFRWRLPKLNGLQLYGEVYGEDQVKALGIIPYPYRLAGLAGIYIPRLTPAGDWDAHIEWANTTTVWYDHSLYTNGYTYYGDILGDAMGNDANRYYLQLTHYDRNATQIAVNFEHLVQQRTATIPQYIDSAWLSARRQLAQDIQLNTAFGISHITNQDYTRNNSDRNYLFNISLSKQY